MSLSVRERMIETRHESADGSWVYRAVVPSAALDGVATLLWDVDGVSGPANERILPTSDVVLIVDRHEAAYGDAFTCGLQNGPILIGPPAESHFTGVRLTPVGAFKVFGMPAHELTDGLIDLGALLDRDADRLRDEIMSKPEPADRIAALERFIAGRITRGPLWHDGALVAWRMLKHFHGAVRVDDAAEAAGLSARQLGRVFQEQVGLSPKGTARLLRFERAMRLIRETDAPLSDIAFDAGYADQSHLTRDFQALAGASPKAYRERAIIGGDHAFMRDD